LFCGYNLKHKIFNLETELIHDLEPLKVTNADAEKLKKGHGDKCDIWAGEGGQWFVKLKRGARVYIPRKLLLAPIGFHSGHSSPWQRLSTMLVSLSCMSFTKTFTLLRLEQAWALAWVV